MKTSRFCGTLLAAIALLAAPAGAAQLEDEREIRTLIQQWVDAADKQDAGLVERILHADTTQFMPNTKAPGGVITISRDQYVAGIRAKKIGGSPRQTQIHSIELDSRGRNAVAKLEIESETMIFYQFVGLSKLAAKEWKIVSVLTDIVARR